MTSNVLYMKAFFFVVLCSAFILTASAQRTVKPYFATIKTLSGTQKGILYQVDSANVIINRDNKLELISFSTIKWIKLKVLKSGDKEFIKFITYDPWSKNNFEKNQNGALVRKWGEKDPTMGEEIRGHIASAAINITGNLLAAPIQSINPSVANYKIKCDQQQYLSVLNELSYYTVNYQLNPDTKAELLRMKAMSANFKP